MIQEERLISLFKNLCLINAPALEERESVAWTKQYLLKMGLEVVEDNASEIIGGNANNLIATLKGTVPSAPRIFLSAHFDTVEPTEGLEIEERDGVFYSKSDTILGADDKGGMAPIIEAVHAFIDSGEPHGDIVLLLSCAEEIGLKGAAALKIEDLDLDFGYVLDTGPPVGSYVTRTGTHDKIDIEIIGKPAHAGKDPEKGINAIQVAARAISQMKLGRIDAETTANLGVIQGGSATNVVCASVLIRAEARSTNEQVLDEQVDHMVKLFAEAASEYGAQVKIRHDRHYRAYNVSEDSMVVQIAQRASRALGLEPALRTTLGGSDANIYNAKGIPSIVVATGMDKIHTHDEYISRADMIKNAELCVEIIRETAKLSRPQKS
ncbi:MAG: M20/M25/M40 family metallo-hydrolase [Armatimonadetes bacterium]|nr:M20/M25/M40 family metallo-hydrolase [Armatimonadota bacterium]